MIKSNNLKKKIYKFDPAEYKGNYGHFFIMVLLLNAAADAYDNIHKCGANDEVLKTKMFNFRIGDIVKTTKGCRIKGNNWIGEIVKRARWRDYTGYIVRKTHNDKRVLCLDKNLVLVYSPHEK